MVNTLKIFIDSLEKSDEALFSKLSDTQLFFRITLDNYLNTQAVSKYRLNFYIILAKF